MKVVSRGVFCLVMNGVLLANVGPNLVTRLSGSPVNAVRNLSRYATMSALVEFFTTPLIGKISDQIGRRTLMVITPFIIACARLCGRAWAQHPGTSNFANHMLVRACAPELFSNFGLCQLVPIFSVDYFLLFYLFLP